MSQVSSYLQGTPCWVELQTSDQDGAKSFYSALFGWTYDDQPMGEGELYSFAQMSGGVVCAISKMQAEQQAAGAPPWWMTYLAVDDVDAAATRVKESGGQILMPPFDVMEAGRMTVIMDPTNVVVGLWQAGQHIGATIVNEPGAIIWNELITDDGKKALPFYNAVASIGTEENDLGGMPYTMLTVDGRPVGGSMAPPMPEAPNHWHAYFATADLDAGIATATKHGATLVTDPIEISFGKFGLLTDPQGASFSLFQGIDA